MAKRGTIINPYVDDWLDIKLGQLGDFLGDIFSEEIPAEEKISRFSELVEQPINDKDDERTDLLDMNFVRQEFQRMLPLELYFRPEIRGTENIPQKGGAVVVSNHVLFSIDTMLLNKLILEKSGRLLRPTVDRFMIRLPWFRSWVMRMGCVTGRRENALRLAKSGELVLSYPGGAREALKSARRAYDLIWEGATGFVKVAIQAQVPIIPIASVGGDESYSMLSEDNGLLRRVMGSIKYTMPFYVGLGPLPLPVKFLFAVGEPIDPGLPAKYADDEQAVAEVQQRVRTALDKLLDETRLRRGPSVFG